MQRLLGVEVPDDAQGVLQDVHWGAGLFGYFPTYTLGNLIAAQLWTRLRSATSRRSTRSSGAASSRRCAMAARAHPPPRPQVPAARAAAPRDRRHAPPEPFLAYLRAKLADVAAPG